MGKPLSLLRLLGRPVSVVSWKQVPCRKSGVDNTCNISRFDGATGRARAPPGRRGWGLGGVAARRQPRFLLPGLWQGGCRPASPPRRRQPPANAPCQPTGSVAPLPAEGPAPRAARFPGPANSPCPTGPASAASRLRLRHRHCAFGHPARAQPGRRAIALRRRLPSARREVPILPRSSRCVHRDPRVPC